MKIVIIGTTAAGIYGFRADLIKKLVALNYEVYTFISEYSENDLERILKLGAIPKLHKLRRSGLNPVFDIKSMLTLTYQIKRINPDIVFSYFSKPIIYGSLAAKIARVPKNIGMLEGLGYAFTEQPLGLSKKTKIIKNIQVGLYKVALPRLDHIIFLNPDDPKDLLERYSIKTNTIHILGGIGLNLDAYPYSSLPSHIEYVSFLFIGRLLKEKGIHEFISAAKIVKKTYPSTKFTVLGTIDDDNPGSLKETELKQLVSLGIIEYPGYVDNINQWIANSHVFVLPSYREGVPRSTQEAMAIGRAVITTDVPGCRETVIHGVNGFLVEKWNPQALADKMIYFIEHPEQISEMGHESYKIAQEKFDANKVNKRLIEILGL